MIAAPVVRRLVTLTAVASLALMGVTSSPSLARESARDVAIRAADPNAGPLITIVSLRKQKLRVFDLNGEVTSSRVSSGQPGFDTPTGVFSLLEKNVYHQSNIYAGAEMPFMQRLTWSGIALHAGHVPGYRASHGCIRLPYSFAKSLFDVTKLGGRVVVAQDETQPLPFDHPKLFRPLPQSTPAAPQPMAQAGTRVASNDIAIGTNATGGLSEFPRLFGVTPALAEAVKSFQAPSAKPATRLEADRAVRERLSRAETDLKVIESVRKAATEVAKAAVQASAAANARLATLRKDGDQVQAGLRAAEAKLAAAEQAFEAFIRSPHPRGSATEFAVLQDTEADLEDGVLNATLSVDAARVGVARNELAFAETQAAAVTSDTTRARALTNVQKAVVDLKSAQLAMVEVKRDIVRRSKPISVLISLKSSRIYVRQGFEPVLEAPISVSQPIDRVGTHVLTAMRFSQSNADTFEWRLVTAQMPPLTSDAVAQASRKSRQREADSAPMPASAAAMIAASALDAVVIPQDILDTISERATPGSSLILTDRELKANENGPNTEFVLLTR
ncbi:MAG: L,D-transpeptidase family protein [Hyphomicrobium sp.]|nr:L,D-transpeptidase family protein [Hyphomicrobium sp.]